MLGKLPEPLMPKGVEHGGTIWSRWHDGTVPGRQTGWLLWQVVAERGPYLDVRPLWSEQTETIHRHCLTGELAD